MSSRYSIISILYFFILFSCQDDYHSPLESFDSSSKIVVTDYRQLNNRAAHPEKEDMADRIPGSTTLSDQKDLPADVFFIHPTTLLGQKGENKPSFF